MPLISICIPAYKRTDFLKRLLNSITIQEFADFEVIVTDDSPGNEVEQLCQQYSATLPLQYFKNTAALGTPENWNQAIRKAKGEWIKLMHDDDWFRKPEALQKFADAAAEHSSAIIFSAYFDVFLSTNKEKKVMPDGLRFRQLKKESSTLLSRNIIGPPSVLMHRNDGRHWYDKKLKWLVDVDMYIRRLEDDKIVYLPEPLINVGVGDEQVTASVHGAPGVEIPEHFYFLEKTRIKRLKHILVYDYWWRFIRNFSLYNEADARKYGVEGTVHPVLKSMMRWQKRLPRKLLMKGFISKIIMATHFLLNRHKLR
ncbi:MAG TPA: glycosyltransferase family 2 protein [Chitinophagaceae bacterium]